MYIIFQAVPAFVAVELRDGHRVGSTRNSWFPIAYSGHFSAGITYLIILANKNSNPGAKPGTRI